MRPQWYEKRSEINLKGKDTDLGNLNWFLPDTKENNVVGKEIAALEKKKKLILTTTPQMFFLFLQILVQEI